MERRGDPVSSKGGANGTEHALRDALVRVRITIDANRGLPSQGLAVSAAFFRVGDALVALLAKSSQPGVGPLGSGPELLDEFLRGADPSQGREVASVHRIALEATFTGADLDQLGDLVWHAAIRACRAEVRKIRQGRQPTTRLGARPGGGAYDRKQQAGTRPLVR